jgi:hypothetical protein
MHRGGIAAAVGYLRHLLAVRPKNVLVIDQSLSSRKLLQT